MAVRENPIRARLYIRKFAKLHAGACGMSPEELYRDILRVKHISRISLQEYLWTGCWALSGEQKRSVSTLYTRAEFRRRFTDRRYKGILTHKYYFSRVFSEFYRRDCVLLSRATPETLFALAEKTGKIVIKPNCKGQGREVAVLPLRTDEDLRAVQEAARKTGDGIAEAYIVQHPALAAFNPGAVHIIRFYSICSPMGAMLFAPVLTVANTLPIANGSRDALTAMVDIRTGLVATDAVDQNAVRDYAAHPVTGHVFRGAQIPFWKETIDMMCQAVPMASRISNVGWDIAITPEGPLIVEANTIPGFNSAQYRGFASLTDGFFYQPLFDEGMTGRTLEHPERYERVLLRLHTGTSKTFNA